MSDYIWETFDDLFKTVYGHGRRVEELETRVADLERRLQERTMATVSTPTPKAVEMNEMPTERAA